MKNYIAVVGAAVVGLTLAAASSNAQLITFGVGASIPGGGTLLNQELFQIPPGSPLGANYGSISSWVVNDPTLDAQGLIFIYQVVNTGPDAISQVEVTGFTSGNIVSTHTYTGTAGSLSFGAAPVVGTGGTSANFTGFGDLGSAATFENGALGINGTSYLLAIFTSSPNFGPSYGQTQDDFSTQGNILAPVPEANTVVAGALMLLPLGIGAVRALRKERTA